MATEPGALTVGSRMERMEASLERIEQKLDSKVSRNDMEPVMRRIELLEAGETPLGRVMLKQWESLTGVVNDFSTHGSKEAQEALRRIEGLEAEVDALKSTDISRRAEDRRSGQVGERHFKLLAAAVSVAVVLLMIVQIIGVFLR